MKSTDREAFAHTVVGHMQEVYEKTVSAASLSIWFSSLQRYELAAVQAAFASYITDPNDCRFPPKPGDIIRHIERASADDGRPGADEAWGMLLRLLKDERETGVLTEEMRSGWEVCGPILDLGDEVGARMAFRETYNREVEKARKMAVAPRWTPTLGTDPTLRNARLIEAVRAGRIGADSVRSMLTGPNSENIAQVAGLLEGPGASAEELRAAARLHELAALMPKSIADLAEQRTREIQATPPESRAGALAAMLRTSMAESAHRRADDGQRQRDEEAAKKAAIRDLLDQHQRQQAGDADAA